MTLRWSEEATWGRKGECHVLLTSLTPIISTISRFLSHHLSTSLNFLTRLENLLPDAKFPTECFEKLDLQYYSKQASSVSAAHLFYWDSPDLHPGAKNLNVEETPDYLIQDTWENSRHSLGLWLVNGRDNKNKGFLFLESPHTLLHTLTVLVRVLY